MRSVLIILGMHLSVPVAHADVFECATTSITAFRGGPPEPQQGPGDTFTFDTISGVQRYILPDTPAYRFLTPKGHIYAKRLEAVMGDRAKATAIIDEMMADKNIGEPNPEAIKHKFDILSSKSALALSASAKACAPDGLCLARFLSIRLPGESEVVFKGKKLKFPVPEGTFILVEGNTFSVQTGACKKVAGSTARADPMKVCEEKSGDEAIAACTEAIRNYPHNAEAYLYRGAAYGEKGDQDKVIADTNKAIEIDPKLARAYDVRAFAYVNKKDYDRGIADYTKAIEISPKRAQAYYGRAIAHKKKGEVDQAVGDYSKVIELDPKHARAYTNRGAIYDEKGEPDRAIGDFTKAIEIDQKDVLAYHNRGFSYYKKGDLDRAIADFRSALRIDPTYEPSKRNRRALATPIRCSCINANGCTCATRAGVCRLAIGLPSL